MTCSHLLPRYKQSVTEQKYQEVFWNAAGSYQHVGQAMKPNSQITVLHKQQNPIPNHHSISQAVEPTSKSPPHGPSSGNHSQISTMLAEQWNPSPNHSLLADSCLMLPQLEAFSSQITQEHTKHAAIRQIPATLITTQRNNQKTHKRPIPPLRAERTEQIEECFLLHHCPPRNPHQQTAALHKPLPIHNSTSITAPQTLSSSPHHHQVQNTPPSAASSSAAIQLGTAPQPQGVQAPRTAALPSTEPQRAHGELCWRRQSWAQRSRVSSREWVTSPACTHSSAAGRAKGSKTSCSVSKGSSSVAAVEPAGFLAAPHAVGSRYYFSH